MILSRFVFTKVAIQTYEYWINKGYNAEKPHPQLSKKSQRIKVKVEDLMPKSSINVSCKCDECGKKYIQRFGRNKDVCYECRKRTKMLGNTLGTSNKGKKIPSMTGSNHPRWNPNKKDFQEYAYTVRRITEETYVKNKDVLNPENLPRTLCGINGGYQLDHRISIHKGFKFGINPKVIGSLDNLQMLPWKDNRSKHK